MSCRATRWVLSSHAPLSPLPLAFPFPQESSDEESEEEKKTPAKATGAKRKAESSDEARAAPALTSPFPAPLLAQSTHAASAAICSRASVLQPLTCPAPAAFPRRKTHQEDSDDDDEEEKKPAAKTVKLENGAKTPAPTGAAADVQSVIVRNLPWSADEDALWAFFEPAGAIARVHIAMDRDTGKPRGFAFVDFETPAAAQKATTLTGKLIGDREVRVELSLPKDSKTPGTAPRSAGGAREGDDRTVFVKGFDRNVGEDAIRQNLTSFFEECGASCCVAVVLSALLLC